MHSYFRTVDVVDFSIIAHATNKWYPVPFANYSVPNIIGVLVTYLVEVIGLAAHVKSIGFVAACSLRQQLQN